MCASVRLYPAACRDWHCRCVPVSGCTLQLAVIGAIDVCQCQVVPCSLPWLDCRCVPVSACTLQLAVIGAVDVCQCQVVPCSLPWLVLQSRQAAVYNLTAKLLLRSKHSSSSYFLFSKTLDSLHCICLQLDHNALCACNHNALEHLTW